MIPVTVPAEVVGSTEAELIVSAWLYPEGARVREGVVLAEVMADKASFELTSPATGTLRILVPAETGFAPEAVIAEVHPDCTSSE